MNPTVKRGLRIAAFVALALVLYGWQEGEAPRQAPPEATAEAVTDGAASRIAQAAAARESGFMVEVTGRVDRTLADDNEGSRHQRFILTLSNGHTVLVAHNIDLAERVPLREGAEVRVKGQYEWNPRGGVLHWTHHDPGGRRPGGWIRAEGREFR